MQTLITKDLVLFLAKLGQLQLTDQQVLRYQNELNEIVNYVTMVGQMPTKGLQARFHTTDNTNIFQENKQPSNTFTQKQALLNAKLTKRGMFVVPRIIKK